MVWVSEDHRHEGPTMCYAPMVWSVWSSRYWKWMLSFAILEWPFLKFGVLVSDPLSVKRILTQERRYSALLDWQWTTLSIVWRPWANGYACGEYLRKCSGLLRPTSAHGKGGCDGTISHMNRTTKNGSAGKWHLRHSRLGTCVPGITTRNRPRCNNHNLNWKSMHA